MAAGHYQEYDLFTDKETREQADTQRRELAAGVRDFLEQHAKAPVSVHLTQLVRSYTIAFRTADGSHGMVLVWSARNLALTFQGTENYQPPETNVLHNMAELLRGIDKILNQHSA